MKKKWMAALLTAAVILGAVFVWRMAYGMRKSNDHLPPLTTIAEMSEAEINSLLPGYKITQLEEVWGKPDVEADSMASWNIGAVTLTVNYKNNGAVAICGLKDASGAPVGENMSEIPGGTRFIIQIRDRAEEERLPCAEAEELFYEDETAKYYFSVIKSHHIEVTYNNGNSEDLVTALNAGRATIADLEKFGIEYHTEPKN